MDTLQYLTNKIQYLELKLDSIQHIDNLNELTVRVNEQANIISNVGSFYESAWLKLIIVISVLGIVVPFIIQYFQKDNLKQVSEFLSKEIKETFNLRIKELENSNKNQIDELSKKVNSELETLKTSYECISNELEASLYYLQGKQSFAARKYASAFNDFIKSTKYWIKSSRNDRVTVMLANIENCIIGMRTLAAFNNAIKTYEIDWDNFMVLMKENIFLKDKIVTIKNTINKLQK